MELLNKLGIDWHLFLAQIVNFLILLFVLYKFLYKPVLKMLHDRTSRIEKSLADAQKIEANLKQAEEERMTKIVEARKEAQKIMEEAKKEVEKARQKATEEAREEAVKILKAGKEQLKAEKEEVVKELKREVASLAIVATEQLLQDVMTEKMEETISEAAVRKFGRA